MTNDVELFVFDDTGATSIEGNLDYYNATDLPIAITFALKDARNIKDAKSSFTKTFNIPASRHNLNILQNITSEHATNFDAIIKEGIKCRISANGIIVFTGVLRVNAVLLNHETDNIEVTILGDNNNWITKFNNEKMCENQSFDSNTTRSWTNSYWNTLNTTVTDSDESNFVIPVVCHGQWTHNEVNANGDIRYKIHQDDVTPAPFIKSLVYHYFNNAGYNVVSDFMETDLFKKLCMPLTFEDFRRTDAQLNNIKAIVSFKEEDIFASPRVVPDDIEIAYADTSGGNSAWQYDGSIIDDGSMTSTDPLDYRILNPNGSYTAIDINALYWNDFLEKRLGLSNTFGGIDSGGTRVYFQPQCVDLGNVTPAQPSIFTSLNLNHEVTDVGNNHSTGSFRRIQSRAPHLMRSRSNYIAPENGFYNVSSHWSLSLENNCIVTIGLYRQRTNGTVDLISSQTANNVGMAFFNRFYYELEIDADDIQMQAGDKLFFEAATEIDMNNASTFFGGAYLLTEDFAYNSYEKVGYYTQTSLSDLGFNFQGLSAGQYIVHYIDRSKAFAQFYQFGNNEPQGIPATGVRGCQATFTRSKKISNSNQYKLSEVLPCKPTKLEFIAGLTGLFNLIWYTDELAKKVYVEPYDSFYRGITESVDWSAKQHHEGVRNEFLTSAIDKKYLFRYKKDTADKFQSEFNEQLEIPYHSEQVEIGDPINSEIEELGTSFFSASIMLNEKDTTFTKVGGIWCAYIGKKNTDEPQLSDKSERAERHNYRILSYEGLQDVFGGQNIYLSAVYNVNSGTTTQYPQAISYRFPDLVSSTLDVNLGYNAYQLMDMTESVHGLYEVYWKNFLRRLADSPIIKKALFRLQPLDIAQLDFRKPVYLTQSNGSNDNYWLINKIIDYKPHVDGLTQVELIKWTNIEDASAVTTIISVVGGLGNSNAVGIEIEADKDKDKGNNIIFHPNGNVGVSTNVISQGGLGNSVVLGNKGNHVVSNSNVVVLGNKITQTKMVAKTCVIAGQYNAEATEKSLFVIGGGTSERDRHNIFEVTSDGQVFSGGQDIYTEDANGNIQDLYVELDSKDEIHKCKEIKR